MHSYDHCILCDGNYEIKSRYSLFAIRYLKKVRQNRNIYFEPANYAKLVHIMLELAYLEIKMVNLYFD